jgi:4-hydroxybenzoate polyprenyltransferase
MMLGIFHKPLGFPDWTEFVLVILGAVGGWYVLWLQRRAKKHRDASSPTTTPTQNRRYTILMIAVVFVAAVTSPFILPYTGVRLPFVQEVLTSIIAFIVCVTIIIIVRRGRGKV